MKYFFTALIFLAFTISSTAQNSRAHTRISIITCAPGDELYSLFGHTAIRVVDSVEQTDVVYNWGGFTFEQNNFYLKFLRGKLLYYSSADNFPDFMYEYVFDHRSVYEQVLNVDSASKQNILNAIAFNMQGNNRFYKYDFLLDNCTTRAKNILFENVKGAALQNRVVPDETTSRDLIHYYLERGGQNWTELGIDILLGTMVDKKVSNDEAMFMPEFFMKGLASAKKENKPLAAPAFVLLQGNTMQQASGKYVPLIVLAGIAILIFLVSKINAAWAQTVTRFVDALLLYVTGLLGLLLLFMWFATDHTVCKNNFNLAWALPFNFPVAFIILKKPAWLSNYFFIVSVITAVLLATWFWLPQQLNIALLPFVMLMLNRYIHFTLKYRRLL